MTNEVFMGIDIGTTSVKAAAFDGRGRRLGLFTEDYALDTSEGGKVIEFDPEKYAQICFRAVDEMLAVCGHIDAISVDTQGETMILADAEGKPLAPAVVWLDNRAGEEAGMIKERYGCEYVYGLTGQPEITAGWPASKLLWFRRRRPEVFEAAEKIFLLEDWILFRLTGSFVTEPCIQSSSVYFDIKKGDFDPGMLDFIGVPRRKLPELLPTGSVCGRYRGSPVVTGTLDQLAGTLGSGVADVSEISEMTGTIMAICAMCDGIPPYSPDSIIPCHVHAVRGKYCRILWSSTAGMALKWFRTIFCENMTFRQIDEAAVKVPAGCEGLTLLPYFTGSTMPRYNPDATASFTGITLAHTRAHFARAVMESVAFMLRQDLEYLGADGIREIRITGGGASGTLWPQIKADVTGKTLCTLTESETACLGSAMIAAFGVSAFGSLSDAAKSLVRIKDRFTPSGADYSEAYRRFCEADRLLNR